MSFPVDDILLGPATFGRLHRLDGWIHHTGEEPAFTRAYAVSTANWQRTNPGSYNFRIYDRASDPRGVMLNVPYLEASGGINPSSPAWAPGRFPFLERELGKAGPCPVSGCPGPYRNPTMHHLQLSYVGRTGSIDAGLAPDNYLPDAKALVKWSESLPNRGPAPLVHSKHAHWQSNRSDPGNVLFAAFIPEVPVADLPYFKPNTGTVRSGAPFRTAPAGAEVGKLTGGPIVILGELPAGSPRWFLAFVGARSKDGTTELGMTVPDSIAWVARGDVTVDATPINLPFVQRVGKAVYTDDPIGLDTTLLALKAELEAANEALDSANKRTATVKTAAAEFMRKVSKANADLSTGAEAGAVAIEGM